MDIAIDVRSLLDGRPSGVATYTEEILRALLRVAPEHTYHLFYNSARWVRLPTFTGNVELHASHYPNKVFNSLQYSLHRPRWDALVGADCFFMPNARLLPLSPGTPYVTTVHDLSYEYFPQYYSARRRIWHRLMRSRELVQNSTEIIAVSHATALDVERTYGVAAERITVIHSGIRAPAVPASAAEQAQVRRQFNLPPRFVLYFGTLEPRKNIPSLIRAWDAIAERVPQDLVIAGARGWLTHAIDASARRSRWPQRIHFTGPVAERDKHALYAAADVFVYPSFYEGFGFPPLEALLCGTPVVTSQNASLPEVVGDWAVLINPYHPGELARVLLELLPSPPPVALAVRQQITQRFSWDAAAAATLAVINQAAG